MQIPFQLFELTHLGFQTVDQFSHYSSSQDQKAGPGQDIHPKVMLCRGCYKGAGKVVDINDDKQSGEDTTQECLVCLQIIGAKQDDDEKEIQENELVGDEIIDSGYAD